MKNNTDDFIEKALNSLTEGSQPSQNQKQRMLEDLLFQIQTEEDSKVGRFRNMVTVYPWRFGFGVSALQAVLLTLMFGSNYTNFILQFLGR
ncbi:hypothetical protein [Acetobacterium woodii]|uniref:Uncharacterized protein n=1 Tax=Acetobacterium woodii (strain ATCC 29683 / DSM 1030 / JCM 2381 / KCTC 1655 / WB1) TaxID=931626 RepID=H6LIF5_ACEWD|nr:hypothetical protein [Acetobacterium woodii]AFA47329.1 hypothetical protein Awo_c05300 [Acetobacterium woodii DSM 1030]